MKDASAKTNNMHIFSTDNHPTHHIREVIERVYDSGAIIRFLPPYSSGIGCIKGV